MTTDVLTATSAALASPDDWPRECGAGGALEANGTTGPRPAQGLQIPLVIRFLLAGAPACDQGSELLDVVPGPQARDGGLVGWPGLGEQFG